MDTMRRLAKALDDLAIPFVIAGAMAANAQATVGLLLTWMFCCAVRISIDSKSTGLVAGGLIFLRDQRGSKIRRMASKSMCLSLAIFLEMAESNPLHFRIQRSVKETAGGGLPFLSLKALLELKFASVQTALHSTSRSCGCDSAHSC